MDVATRTSQVSHSAKMARNVCAQEGRHAARVRPSEGERIRHVLRARSVMRGTFALPLCRALRLLGATGLPLASDATQPAEHRASAGTANLAPQLMSTTDPGRAVARRAAAAGPAARSQTWLAPTDSDLRLRMKRRDRQDCVRARRPPVRSRTRPDRTPQKAGPVSGPRWPSRPRRPRPRPFGTRTRRSRAILNASARPAEPLRRAAAEGSGARPAGRKRRRPWRRSWPRPARLDSMTSYQVQITRQERVGETLQPAETSS